jgi:LCP family protein required for cell wall assembly
MLSKEKPLAHKILEKIMAVVAVALTLLLIIAMALNAPIVSYTSIDNGVKSTRNISVLSYYKNWKPLINIEGTLENNDGKNFDIIEPSANETIASDGLDLDQIIEGQYTILFLGFDESGELSDVDWVFQIDLKKQEMNVLQIPRDSFVSNYTNANTGKFNSIYKNGDQSVSPIQRVVNAVQDNFGFAIDAYVTLQCSDIANIVDSIGGVPITLPEKIIYEADKILEAGEQTLTGEQAEWFVRFRHGYDDGDIGRVQAQRIFMAAAFSKAFDMGTIETYKALKNIYDNQWIATNLSLDDISRLCDLMSVLDMNNVNVYMVPGEGANYYPSYGGYQSVWSIHKRATIELLNTYFRPYQSDIQYDSSPLVELVAEGSYLSVEYDNQSATLQTITDNAKSSEETNTSTTEN